MALWIWQAGRRDERLQVKEENEQPPPGELTCCNRIFWCVLLVLRCYLAVRFFNIAVGHITFAESAEDQILNTTAMVFVLEIDEVIMQLTFSPEMINLLSKVPAVSGDLPYKEHVASLRKSATTFVKLQFYQGFVRFLGFMWATGWATWIWLQASAGTDFKIEGPEELDHQIDLKWVSLFMIHGAPYTLALFLHFGYGIAGKLVTATNNEQALRGKVAWQSCG